MNLAAAGPGETLWSGLWLFAFVAAFRGYGSALLRLTGLRRFPGVSGYALEAVFSVALGLFALSLWSFACGASGFFTMRAYLLFAGMGAVLFVLRRKEGGQGFFRTLLHFWRNAPPLDRFLAAAFMSLALSTFLGACAPETGNDALSYHLYFPKLYAEAGKLLSDIPHPRALWPGFAGMVYTAGLVVQGTVLAKLFSWLSAILLLVSVPAAAACFLPDKNAARAAALFVFFAPVIWMQSLYAYSDNLIALYAFLAFAALWAWGKGEKHSAGALLPAAFFLSALASIKLYALTHAFFLGALALWIGWRAQKARGAVKAAGVLTGAALVFAGFWYCRSWALTGNPVYPFFPDFFSGHGFEQTMVGRAGLPKTVWDFASLPWRLAAHPDLFGGEPFGALFAMAFPLTVFFWNRSGDFARAALILALAYAAAWFMSIQLARFLIPAIAPAAVGLGAVSAEWFRRRKPLTGATLAAVFGAALLQFGLAHYYAIKMMPPALGFEASEHYLRRSDRSYPFMRALDAHVSRNEKTLVVNESRLYYASAGTVLYGPLAALEMRTQNLSFRDWLSRNRVAYVLVASRDEASLAPGLYLTGDQTVAVEPVPVSTGSSLDPQDPMHYALWRLAR